jgi:hypothetical protein
MRSRDVARFSLMCSVLFGAGACFETSEESALAPPGYPGSAESDAAPSDAVMRDAARTEAADGGERGPDDIVVDGGTSDGGVVLDCVKGAVSAVHVEFECSAVTVYTCKDLSNLVIEFEDGTRQRFEGQKGHTNVFSGTGTFAGKRIVRVWVKAGANHSGDGPGYGERVETTVDGDCDVPQAGSGGAGGTTACIEGPDVSCVPQPTSGVGGPMAGRGGAGGASGAAGGPD